MIQPKKISVQRIFTNSRFGINLAVFFGRVLPPRLGYPLVRRVADWIASHKDWAIVRGARLNQWMVSYRRLARKELDQAVVETFRNQSRALYDFYRYWNSPPEKQTLIQVDPSIRGLIERSQRLVEGQGAVVVGIHLSNFDYALRLAVRLGLQALVITLSDLPGGYQQQFEMRRSAGMEIATASVATFRRAVSRLEAGGVVLTGIDRPISNPKYRPCFFGHPSALPVHYIQLALRARVPVLLGALELQSDGIYRFLLSEPIWMKSYTDHHEQIVRNAEAVLTVAEAFICRAPHQWAMFWPVWPDLMDQVASV